MAYAAVAFLWDNLNDLMMHHLDLIHVGAEQEEVLELINELALLKDVLERVPTIEGKVIDEGTEEAYQEVREAVYQLEDTIDTVIAERRSSRSKTSGSGTIPRLGSTSSTRLDIKPFTQDTLKPLINKVQTQFADLLPLAGGDESDLPVTYNLQPCTIAPLKATAQEYIGNDLETLINLIISKECSDKLRVVSVVGMGGVGKTTVARKIFRDPRITYEFPILIWVTVSEVVDMRNVWLTILRSFTSRDMSSKTDDELLEIVPQYLRMGQFFMVLDDLWSRREWDRIKEILPVENKKNSRVLVTTRIPNVAYYTSTGDEVHYLRLLTSEESWTLLQLKVWHPNNCPSDLEEVANAIARISKGIPLIILIIAGTLKKIMSKSTLPLKKQLEDAHQKLRRVDGTTDYSPMKLIQWSYCTLPDYLKHCFLYLGMLPEDTEIPVWKLTQLWVSEGLVRQKQGQTLEETAKDYLMELIHTNLLMVSETSLHGEVKTFHVHGLSGNFCSSEADRQNLFKVIYSTDAPPTSRHLSIHADFGDKFLSKELNVQKARTFLCFSRTPVALENKDVSIFTNAFDLVRVLDANNIKFPTFPTKLTQLVHLRYITLYCDELKILPESISNLWNLQTLVVYTLSLTLEIQADIWKLMHLRFLKTKASMSLTKWEGDGCENLHTLTQLSLQSYTSCDVPSKAKNLKELGIRGMLSDSLSFEKLDSLETLKLQHDVFPRKQSDYPLACLPQPTRFPPKLKFLVLSRTHLDWKHISVLGSLRTLEALKLKDNAFKGDKWAVADDHFRCLEGLSITEADLKYWTASGDCFPKLKNLELSNCEKLLEVPLALGETLEKLYMSVVTRYAVSCAEKIKEARIVKGDEFKLEVYYGDM